MSTKSLGNPGQRCKLILQHCLAIQLCKPGHTPEDFWMYDSGYIVFQNFLAANAQCWWNAPLTAATRALKYAGHVAPGMLLVTAADPCALEILRGAYARSVLKPPATYVISSVGDIDDCIITPTLQGQFTPLPEAICNVIMDLTSEGQSATIENVRKKLSTRFPHMSLPAIEIIYDTLAQLMQEQKIYQTSKGYFIFTPEKRRSRSRTRNSNSNYCDLPDCNDIRADMVMTTTSSSSPVKTLSSTTATTTRPILMTNVDALRSFYGEISTERDGDLTHQCIQTNLTDVICGGNPNDKILYARVGKRRSASFPTPRSLERRHSLRFFGSSSKRLQRFSSTRSLSKTYVQSMTTDSSSSEFQSTDSSTRKKGSLLSRLFRRRNRPKHERLETFSAQFPPAEWFNSRTVHLHSVGTQTSDIDMPLTHTYSNSTFYTGSEIMSQRSAVSTTLPRRRHRRHLSSESTFLLSSRDCSPVRRRSPATYSSNSLPHSTHSIAASTNNNNNNNNNNDNVKNTTNNNNNQSNNNNKNNSNNNKGPNMPLSCSNQVEAMTVPPHTINQISQMNNNKNKNSSRTASNNNRQQITDFDCDETFFERSNKTSAHSSSLDIQCNTPVRSYLRSSLPLRHSAALREQAKQRNESPSPSLSPSPSPSRFANGLSSSNASSTHSSTTTVAGQTPALRRSWRTQQMKRERVNNNNNNNSLTNNHNNNNNSAITLQVTTTPAPITSSMCTPTTTEWHVGGNGTYNVNGQCNNNIPQNTKIYVQNTPMRNVIKFENEQVLSNSNVFIINNETLTNANGVILNKTLSTQVHKKQQQPANASQEKSKINQEKKEEEEEALNKKEEEQEKNKRLLEEFFENKSIEEFNKISYNLQQQQQPQEKLKNDDNETFNVKNHAVLKRAKSISYHNHNNNNNNSNYNSHNNNNNNNNKDNNNKNNNLTMNNNRRLSMPQTMVNTIGHYGSTHLIYKNNVRKNNDMPQQHQQQHQEQQLADLFVGNLGYYEKNNYKMLSNNTLCEAKNLRNSNQYIYNHHNNNNNNIYNKCHSRSNSNNSINCCSGGIGGSGGIGIGSSIGTGAVGGNLAQLLLSHKHMMESEPNLITLNETNNYFFSANDNATKYLKTKPISAPAAASSTATIAATSAILMGKGNDIKNHSSVGTLTTLNDENRFSFPTLNDISFNFTSLAAQKILQAVSLNSIDTLVELNLDAAKKLNKQQQQQHHKQDNDELQQQQQQDETTITTTNDKNTIHTTTTLPATKTTTLCATDYGLV